MAAPISRPAAPAPAAVSGPVRNARPPTHHASRATAELDRFGGGVRVVTRHIRELITAIPAWMKAAIAALALLALALGLGARLLALKNRRIEHQRARLAEDLDALEAAVVPDVPRRVGGLLTSVARHADANLAARGGFYDIFPLASGRVGVVFGGVTADGADALPKATLVRQTLRALLEAEAVPRRAVQTVNRVVGDELAGVSARVVVAVHDRRLGTLTYACAGHAPPVLLGPPEHLPVPTGASAPIGLGGRTGVRQTTISFPAGSLACFSSHGSRERLIDVIEDLGPLASARQVLDSLADSDALPEDTVVCLLRPAGAKTGPARAVEELELAADEIDAGMAADFMRGCGVGEFTVERYDQIARRTVHKYGGASGVLVRVRVGVERMGVEVLVTGREWPYGPAPAPAALVG